MNRFISNTVVAPCLTEDECVSLIKESNEWREGKTVKSGVSMINKDVRSVQISKYDLSDELLKKIFLTVFDLNTQTFRFHIEGFYNLDLPRIFKYSEDRKDHYTWHHDMMINDDMSRKLSFSIQLSDPADYDGGDLEFMPTITDSNIKKRGAVILFPPYLTHRVSPITRGTRYVIVGWMQGPRFR